MSTYELSTRAGKERWLEPHVDRPTRTVTFRVTKSKPPADSIKDGRGSRFRCLVCGQITSDGHARIEGSAGRMGTRLLAVVVDNGRSREYVNATDADRVLATLPEPRNVPAGAVPERALSFRVRAYGMTRYTDLFTRRQLVTLTVLSDLVGQARDRVLVDGGSVEYADAVATYLALGASKLTDYNSSLVVWSPSRDQAKSTFARQALPMVWDFAEINPFGNAAGDLAITLAGVAKAIERLPAARSLDRPAA